ncbi:MAG: hypothetical protein ABI761_13490 [Saprospiraceae bacterium]
MIYPAKTKALFYHLTAMMIFSLLFISCYKDNTYMIVNGSYPDCSFPGYTDTIQDRSPFQSKSPTRFAYLIRKDSSAYIVADAYLLNKN